MSNINKDLLKAMKGVEKKFGKTMSNFATEIEEKEIVSYSTGSKLIDLAIGSGNRAGLPEGRMLELYGPESSGKCITADTYILTPEGYKTLGTIFHENGTPVEVKEEEIAAEIPLVNKNNEKESTYAITFNGKKEVLEVVTQHGFAIEITENHPLLSSGEWVKGKDLKVGQTLSLLKGTQQYNETSKDPDEIYMVTTTEDSFLNHTRKDTVNFLENTKPEADVALKNNFIQLTGNKDELTRIQLAFLNEGMISSLSLLNTGEWQLVLDLKEVDFTEEKEASIFEDKIISITAMGEKPTFDLAMPDTQSFVGNGIINHNTTIALLAIAERQKIENQRAEEDPEYEKKVCVFIDSEFALDMQLAYEYGVDLEELIIIRSDQAEDAMDILDSYVRTGGIGLAVVDSVN